MDNKYNNEEEGELIIGGYPHEYEKNYDKSKLKIQKLNEEILMFFGIYIFLILNLDILFVLMLNLIFLLV